MRRYDVGIISCSATKWANGMTPLTLYKGSPFGLMLRHAQQRCDEVLVMSAFYGLIRLQEPIRWYEAYLPSLSPENRAKLITLIGEQAQTMLAGKTIISYTSAAYHQALNEAAPDIAATIHRPYRRLGSLQLYKIISNEIKHPENPARR